VFRRLLVGGVIVMAVAGLSPTFQDYPSVEAAPSNAVGLITFAAGTDANANPVGEAIEYRSGTEVVWAFFSFGNVAGGEIDYILRLNGWDYTWGKTGCCQGVASGRAAIPLRSPGGDELPGGAYTLYLYEGDKEVGRGSFGIRGEGGADNGDPRPTENDNDGDDDDKSNSPNPNDGPNDPISNENDDNDVNDNLIDNDDNLNENNAGDNGD
jgi:hypothetical protein